MMPHFMQDFDPAGRNLEEIKKSHDGLHQKFSDLVDAFEDSHKEIHEKLDHLTEGMKELEQKFEDGFERKLEDFLVRLGERAEERADKKKALDQSTTVIPPKTKD
jgi:DNA-binding transcriptional MerR regulator